MSLLQIEKILSIFPEKRIRSDLILLEDKNGNLYIKLDDKLLSIKLQGNEGVEIKETRVKESSLTNIRRLGINQGD